MRIGLKRIAAAVGCGVLRQLPMLLLATYLLYPMCAAMFTSDPWTTLENLLRLDATATDLLLSATTALLCVALVSLLPGRTALVAKILIYALLITTFTARKFLQHEFATSFTPTTLSLLLETNTREAGGFISMFLLNAKGLHYLFLASVVTAGAITTEWLWQRFVKRFSQTACLTASALTVAMLVLTAVTLRDYHRLHAISTMNSATEIIEAVRAMDVDDDYEEFVRSLNTKQGVARCDEDSVNVVLVIGESFNKRHAALYGYTLPTTPFLCQEQRAGRLTAFTDAVAPYNTTTLVLKNMLCLNDMAAGEQWQESPYFLQLFRKAGYRVYMWDNQKAGDGAFFFAFSVMYAPGTSPYFYTSVNDKNWQYDGLMIDDFTSRVHMRGGRNIAVFHINGQHIDYRDKYPESEKVFTAKDIRSDKPWLTAEKRGVVSDYDNAVRYNDMLLRRMTDLVAGTRAAVVFLSDHGDEVYDYRDRCGRPPLDASHMAEFAHSMHDVPLTVWLSPQYAEAYPEIAREVRAAAARPFMTDKLGYLLMRLAHIRSPYYRPDRDVSSPHYRPEPRPIHLRNGGESWDYDSITHRNP